MQALLPIFRLLPFIIFIEGFVSIAVEILTIRQLLPFAGNSVVITSLIIGIFLLFLALGYHKGGRITENLQKKLRNNFLLASLWLGVGLVIPESYSDDNTNMLYVCQNTPKEEDQRIYTDNQNTSTMDYFNENN